MFVLQFVSICIVYGMSAQVGLHDRDAYILDQ